MASSLEVDLPFARFFFGLGARWAEPIAIFKLDKFVFDRTENSLGQSNRLGPGFPTVVA